jgi:hypothetical protein
MALGFGDGGTIGLKEGWKHLRIKKTRPDKPAVI